MILKFKCDACYIEQFVRLPCTSYEEVPKVLGRRYCIRCMTPLGESTNSDWPGERRVILAPEYPTTRLLPKSSVDV